MLEQTYHPSVRGIPMPDRIKRLPTDHRGFPVPKFVAWVDGQADHRVVRQSYMGEAIKHKLCWVCGEPLGRNVVSIIGCMCAVNRVMARPQAHRREAGLPDDRIPAAGVGLKRNPGVECLWVQREHPRLFKAHAGYTGVLFELKEPVETIWYREGREATRAEVEEAIEEGLPTLMGVAREEGPDAVKELLRLRAQAMRYLPR
jgi:hypothetical protein